MCETEFCATKPIPFWDLCVHAGTIVLLKPKAEVTMVGVMIDNDNAPAPENIPTANENTDRIFGQWEHSGSCYRAQAGGHHLKARISYPPNIKPSLFNMFELFFFPDFVKDVIIPKNQHTSNSKWGTLQAFLW